MIVNAPTRHPAVPPAAPVLLLACAVLALATGCARRGADAPPKAVDLYVRGALAQEAGDTAAAKDALTRATRANPELTMAHSLLGDLYREEGDYASALPQYEALARLDPYTAVNFHRLGISYHFLNRMREAATAYARAIRLDPRDWKSHMNLGLVDAALGNNNAAIEHCQRAVSLNPDAPAAHANLGVAYDAGGNRAEAEAAYRRSLALQPAQPAVQTNLANNLLAQKRPQDALPILRGVTETSDSPLARRRYGDALAMSGRDDEAAAQYRRALATDARYYPAMNALASLLMTQYRKGLLLDDRKRDEAVAMWRQSLEINPKQPRVQEQLKAWQPQAG